MVKERVFVMALSSWVFTIVKKRPHSTAETWVFWLSEVYCLVSIKIIATRALLIALIVPEGAIRIILTKCLHILSQWIFPNFISNIFYPHFMRRKLNFTEFKKLGYGHVRWVKLKFGMSDQKTYFLSLNWPNDFSNLIILT